MRKTASLHPLDRLILSHCESGFMPLQDLTQHAPRGTLYRHVATLLGEGALVKRGRTYRTTDEGGRRLAEASAGLDWSILDSMYPPLAWVPTPQHRAIIELILSAIVARQAEVKEDHHPAFAGMRHTLAWKSSMARFLCAMLGLDPATVMLDLATESGRSVWLRRDARGTITFKRDILESPLVIFDDYLEADATLRATIHHFLSGRKVLPVENAIVTIHPVSLLTFNPRPKGSLEEQTTLRAAQLRRLILCNLDRVRLPDLALVGHRPLEAAAKAPPLVLPSPRHDCDAWRASIVRLIRGVIGPAVSHRVDTEMLIMLATGMTGFLDDPERAVQQTIYDFAITADTLGWTQPGWVMTVSRFTLHSPQPVILSPPLELDGHTEGPAISHVDHIKLRRSIMEDHAESAMPNFTISEDEKARLIWLAMDEGIPFHRALEVLLDFYMHLKHIGRDLNDLYSILELSKELQQRAIPVSDVTTTLRLKRDLATQQIGVDDLNAALDLLPLLVEHGLKPDMPSCDTAIRLAARFLASGVPLGEIERWFTSQARLSPPSEHA